jgi:glycosidase
MGFLMRALLLTLSVLGLLLAPPTQATPTPDQRHIASPDWREQIVYFVMIDRFADGDASNNVQAGLEFDANNSAKYSGGDLAGIMAQLDYIQGLGASALWITPPIAHVWWDGASNYGGYHGYWSRDFESIDPHFGSQQDYLKLSQALHARGMLLIQDIVVNHMGNYFSYDDQWRADDATRGYRRNSALLPKLSPARPFELNDPRRAQDLKASIYHWTPAIKDFSEQRQERDFQLAELDDLNTEHARVRSALRRAYGKWIREVGVDAFRIDTAFYVPPEFFDDFLRSTERGAEGIEWVARQTGRDNFLSFGEGFGIDRGMETRQSAKIADYLVGQRGEPRLPSMLNFPLYGSLQEVFARGAATEVLAHRIEVMQRDFKALPVMPTFIDNHDVDRFLAGADQQSLKLALLSMFTLPGIPTIYYGTEQGFREQRAAMFKTGYASQGKDHFERAAPLYQYLAALATLRKSERALTHGRVEILARDTHGPGLLAYRAIRQLGTDSGEALVLINSSDHEVLAAGLKGDWQPGTSFQGVFDTTSPTASGQSKQLGADATLTLSLPPRSGRVLKVIRPEIVSAPAAELRSTTSASSLSISALGEIEPDGKLQVQAELLDTEPVSAHSMHPVVLVLNGNLSSAVPLTRSNDTWSATVTLPTSLAGASEHTLQLYDRQRNLASPARSVRFEAQPLLLATLEDQAGDDHGPNGRYQYPQAASYSNQQDLRRVAVAKLGSDWLIEIDNASLSQIWNPAHGFDHVLHTLYIALPERQDGARQLPQQQAEMPGALKWHFRFRLGGWSAAWHAHTSADQNHEGEPRLPAPSFMVDQANKRLRILLSRAALAGASLEGAQIYLTTWDYDAGYREISARGSNFSYGGAAPEAAKIMDDALIAVPVASQMEVQRHMDVP